LPRQIELNDGAAWEALRPGEFVVFLANAQTEVGLDKTSVPVFENLAEADLYAAEAVSHDPAICAAIYDHRGRAGDPVRRVYHESVRKRFDPERSARRSAWTGGVLLGLFAVWSVIASNATDEHFLWFYIVGVKLLVLGTILFVRGVSFFLGKL
jgi:hypothetical protein